MYTTWVSSNGSKVANSTSGNRLAGSFLKMQWFTHGVRDEFDTLALAFIVIVLRVTIAVSIGRLKCVSPI